MKGEEQQSTQRAVYVGESAEIDISETRMTMSF
jgi:hypothetical protein